ncbi:ribosomal subunit interface protein [Aquabacterium sp. A7-Y]|uniref:ribosomal subunit interface protein n=1 Tax=Aquabacterium sp. A7-Y TaxID=1349605 RepID=UPI00223E8909|nr:ribosomal subunit interface protein [Aquabacterium sp. A7-Y]MCW7540263.1 ribosomal subunit interface protein [Aquabacterium sp. A7-Y]
MHIQLNTDNILSANESLARDVEAILDSALGRFDARLTRVEVHLNDVNSSQKTGPADIRCMLEARVTGSEPVAVTDHGPTVDVAVRGAGGKMQRALDSALGRRNDHRHDKPDLAAEV